MKMNNKTVNKEKTPGSPEKDVGLLSMGAPGNRIFKFC